MDFTTGQKVIFYPSTVHKSLRKMGEVRTISEPPFDWHGTRCVRFQGLNPPYSVDCIEPFDNTHMVHELKGFAGSREVFLDGKKLSPDRSLGIRNHSPDGFAWGYSGSGPAQLSLAICLEIFPLHHSLEIYQRFKEIIIAPLPVDQNFVVTFKVTHLGFALNN